PSDESPVNVLELEQAAGVRRVDRPAVENPDELGRVARAVSDEGAHEADGFLDLLERRDLPGPDRPDRLVGDHDLAEPVGSDPVESLTDLVAELPSHVPIFALLLGLADAEDRL